MKITLWKRRHFKVSLVFYRKFKSTPLMRHHYRSELWCFLKGRGLLEMGDFPQKVTMYDTGHNFFHIKQHIWHKYIPVKNTVILQIQFGRSCEEVDIETV